MKSSDMRAKARAIFGSAIAEPMPNQPNGAKALQQRANARPIPTYKVGGIVKKKNGGAKLLPTGEITGAVRDLYKQSLANASGSKYVRESHPGMAGENVKKINESHPGMSGGNVKKPTSPASGATPPGMSSKPVKKKADGGGMGMKKPAIKPLRRSPEADDVLMTTPRGKRMLEEQKKRDAERERMGMAKRAVADKLLGIPAQKKGGKAGCYSEGGRMKGSTDSARMKGSTDSARMSVTPDEKRKKITLNEKRVPVTLNEKRVRVPSIEYKDGGKAKSKPKDGLAVMIAIGKPMKGMKKPVKRAVGGAGKTRKGMC